MMKARGIKKSFSGKIVLDGIDVTVEEGDVIAVLGPSGSGKTTLLRCLNFLEKADDGMLTFNGKTYDMKKIRKKEIAEIRRQTGFVFQEYNLFLNKTVLDNVLSGLIYARKESRKTALPKAMEALKRVGMEEFANRYPLKLSGGQKQRVAIARAIVTNPKIVYFDEPTSALDPELTQEVLRTMRDLAADGITMLVVTHEMNFAANVANKVIFMDHSVVVEEGPSREFFANPQTERAREFLRGFDETFAEAKNSGAEA